MCDDDVREYVDNNSNNNSSSVTTYVVVLEADRKFNILNDVFCTTFTSNCEDRSTTFRIRHGTMLLFYCCTKEGTSIIRVLVLHIIYVRSHIYILFSALYFAYSKAAVAAVPGVRDRLLFDL